MKKTVYIMTMILTIFLMTACEQIQDITHVGVNAEILEISQEVKGFVVRSLDEDSFLGEKCYINCEAPGTYFIYVNNDTGRTLDLSFSDLMVGDEITVDIKTVENKYALTSRVQLLTQRK